MRVHGKKMLKMEQEKKHGQMVQSLKVIIKKVRNMDRDTMFGVVSLPSMESGGIIIFTVTALISGLMEESTREIGKTTICMVKVFTLGLMAEAMKEIIIMTKNMDMESINGQMVESITVSGLKASSMVKVSMSCQLESREKVFGKEVTESNGHPKRQKSNDK